MDYSHIIEVKHIKEKSMVYDYRVVPKTMIIRNSKFQTDKWVSWTNWTTINMIVDQLATESFNGKFPANIEAVKSIKEENICMQIRVIPLNKSLKEFLRLHDSHDYSMEITVKYDSVPVNESVNVCPGDSYTPEYIHKTLSDESTIFSYKPTPKDMINGEFKNSTEYIPIGSNKETDQIQYKPSKISDDLKKSDLEEPYSPKSLHSSFDKIENSDVLTGEPTSVIKYNASGSTRKHKSHKKNRSPSLSEDDSHHSRYTVNGNGKRKLDKHKTTNICAEKIDKNPKAETLKKDISQDLFGDSDTDEDKTNSSQSQPLASSPISLYEKYDVKQLSECQMAANSGKSREPLFRKTKPLFSIIETPIKIHKKNPKKSSTKPKDYAPVASTSSDKSATIDGWLKKYPSSSSDKTKSRDIDKYDRKKKKIRKIEETLVIDHDLLKKESHAITEQMKRLNKINEQLQDKDDLVPKLELLNLKHFDVQNIIDGYHNYEDTLAAMFNKYKFVNLKQIEQSSDIHHFIAIEICDCQQVKKMVAFLTEKFEQDCMDFPNITELLNLKIIPEWCLMVFMDTFGMTREESIERIRLQEKQILKDSALNWSQSM